MNKEILSKLQEPFDDTAIKFKLQAKSSSGDKGLFVPYVDARDVIARLEEAAPGNWHDTYTISRGPIDDTKGTKEGYYAVCSLTIAGVTRQDVGEGETPKAAVSDALKRAAVKFGVGLHLYTGQKVWAPIDQYGNPQLSHEEMLAIWRGEGQPTEQTQNKPRTTGGQTGDNYRPPTDKQKQFLKRLLADKGVKGDDMTRFLNWVAKEVNGVDKLSAKHVSELIDTLKDEDKWTELYAAWLEETGAEALF